jgi:uncharacterized membrane protein YkoI
MAEHRNSPIGYHGRMTRFATRARALAMVVAAVCLGGNAWAAPRQTERLQVAQLQAASISSDQAAAIARSATGGRVLDVALANGLYMVRVLLSDGRVRTVRIDALTGAIR